MATSNLSPQEEQEKLLEEANNIVKNQSFQMKRCLDNNKLMDALKHCSNMLAELRTGLLSPKYYYELYMSICDQLRHLEAFLVEEHNKGKRLSDLYELVQYAGNILPRLYLLVTVGSVYIETKEAPTKEILIDMVEMCRGIQHPTRGLFLRNYLSQMTKNKLPDTSNSSTRSANFGTVTDSINFALTNFTEMNKLWVRMQHQGHSRDRDRREKERRELKILVGTNLVRLSQLEGVDLELYRSQVLPSILEQVVNCKDGLAQEYLMEVIIQVFHDELHLRTLEMFLDSCSKLTKGVNVKNIVIALIDRLARFAAQEEGGIPDDIPLFDIFSKKIQEIIQSRPDLPIQDVIAMYVSLANMAFSCYPKKIEYINEVLGMALTKLSSSEEFKCLDKSNPPAGKLLQRLLYIPAESYNDIITVLQLDNYPSVIPFLSYSARKEVAVTLVENVLRNETHITEAEQATRFLEIISPLVRDEDGQEVDKNSEEFQYEQNLIASLIHLFSNEVPDKQYQLLTTIRKYFGAGGDRIRYTLPSLIYVSLKLCSRYKQLEAEDELWTKKAQKVFQFAHQTTSALSKASHFELCLRLFLQCAQAADSCQFETIAYEFVTQAFVIYEENISDSKSQLQAITIIIGTLQCLRIFIGTENHDTLTTKCALSASKLLKKPDQCLAVQLCSHLFWSVPYPGREDTAELYRDGKRVLECLQRSLKIADTCTNMEGAAGIHLFVDILNRYLYYFENQNEFVTLKYINGLIDLIGNNLSSSPAEAIEEPSKFFQSTTRYIKYKKANPDEGPSFADIVVQ